MEVDLLRELIEVQEATLAIDDEYDAGLRCIYVEEGYNEQVTVNWDGENSDPDQGVGADWPEQGGGQLESDQELDNWTRQLRNLERNNAQAEEYQNLIVEMTRDIQATRQALAESLQRIQTTVQAIRDMS